MREFTIIEVKNGDAGDVLSVSGVKVTSIQNAKRLGWVSYELSAITEKYKITPVPGYNFLGLSFSGGTKSKWRAIHPQTFPTDVYKPVKRSYNLNTETWYDLVRRLLGAGAEVKTNRRQFKSLVLFERYCDKLGIFRIIPQERGLNK
jgi:hypothetical protein